MHARNRTWLLGSDPVERCRQRTLPVEGGDGSTLSLDFTTGVLDPRLTFTRSSNATFINSSGYVQFANANLMTYSNPRQTGTAWGATGTVTWGSSTLTDPTGGSAAQSITFGTTGSAIFNTTGTTVVSGITHTFSVWMRSATGTTTVRIGDANVAPVATVTLTTTWQRFSCQYTTSGTNDGGAIFSQAGTPSAEFYVWGAQVQPGSIVGELIQTSGTINTNTPRFDYDPSTRQPRGLLIEASASNLLCLSESFATSGGTTNWAYNGNSGAVTSEVNPAGVASSFQFRETATGGGLLHQPVTPASPAGGQTYTFSIWMRGSVYSSVTTTQAQIGIQVGGTFQTVTPRIVGGYAASISGTTICTVSGLSTTQWTRVEIATTASIAASTTVNVFVWPNTTSYENNASVLLWGAQFEAGSGASSYIPTGASTGSRAFDSCVMTGTNFSSWFAGATEGVFYAEYEAPRSLGTADYFCLGTVYAAGTFIGMNLANSTRYPQALISPGGGFRVSGGINVAATTPMKHAAKWSGVNNVLVFANGAVGTAHSATSGTPTFTMFSIGSSSTSGTAATGDYLNACVRRVKFWPVALSNAQIQAITT